MPALGWLCFTSHRQQGHLETAPPFTIPCDGREARFSQREPRAVAWQSITQPLRHASSTPGFRCNDAVLQHAYCYEQK